MLSNAHDILYLLQWSSYQKERIKDVQCHALLQIIGKKGNNRQWYIVKGSREKIQV